MRRITLTLATGFGAGYSPKAPGTVGTLVAIPLIFIIPLNLFVLAGAIILGIIVSHQAEKILGKKDSQEIVIDEIVGLLIAMYLLPLYFVLPAFLLFRFFDITKLGPIKKLERFKGGFGIMIDDIAAGIITNIILQIVYRGFIL